MRRSLFVLAAVVFTAILFSPPLSRCAAAQKPSVPPVAARDSRKDPFAPLQVPPRARSYQRVGYTLSAIGTVWGLLGSWALLQTGLAARLRDIARVRAGRLRGTRRGVSAAEQTVTQRPPPFLAVVVFVALMLTFNYLWSLPTGFAWFARERLFGFGRQSVGGFLWDRLLGTGFDLLVTAPLAWAGFWLYHRSPRHWWRIVWAGLIPLLFGVIVLQPIVFAPAFNTFTPLAPGPLRTELLDLAERVGIHGGRVYVEDTSRRTSHVNAYVFGLGPTTRIVLNDTALQALPRDQILAMMGHEMGHYVEGHIWVGFASGALGAGALLWLLDRLLVRFFARSRLPGRWGIRGGLTDLAALPVALLFLDLLLLAQAPIANGISRELERRADTFGLRRTNLPEASARMLAGFAERDFSDPDPPRLYHFWFGSHPTLTERIAYVRAWKAAHP